MGINPYDSSKTSENQFYMGSIRKLPVGSAARRARMQGYRTLTQASNPGADYLGYTLFSNPGGSDPNSGSPFSSMGGPMGNMFWMVNYFGGLGGRGGGAAGNGMMNQYYLLNQLGSGNNMLPAFTQLSYGGNKKR